MHKLFSSYNKIGIFFTKLAVKFECLIDINKPQLGLLPLLDCEMNHNIFLRIEILLTFTEIK